jgi:2'-hydroxyisoflavone reductase
MRILVLGGTRFVGRAVVDQAVSRGHDVTTFSRGRHGESRPGAEARHGDRTRPRDLLALAARDWDAVVDTSVLAPAHVAAAAALLAGRAGHYTYVSSLAVYSGLPREPVTEESPTWAGRAGLGAG